MPPLSELDRRERELVASRSDEIGFEAMRLPLLVRGLAGPALDRELKRDRNHQPFSLKGKGDELFERVNVPERSQRRSRSRDAMSYGALRTVSSDRSSVAPSTRN